MKILLIRHGKTEANEKRLYCGRTDLPLSKNGERELRLLSRSFPPEESVVYASSGLKRAEQTLYILFGRRPDIIIPELNEMNFGDFEMKSHKELCDNDGYIRWITGDGGCPNGESGSEFKKRVMRGFGCLSGLRRSSAAVTHGGVIVTIMDTLFPSQRDFYEWQPECGEGYLININKNGAASWQGL